MPSPAAHRLEDLIGDTPLVRLRAIERDAPELYAPGGSVKDRSIYAKAEFFNPGLAQRLRQGPPRPPQRSCMYSPDLRNGEAHYKVWAARSAPARGPSCLISMTLPLHLLKATPASPTPWSSASARRAATTSAPVPAAQRLPSPTPRATPCKKILPRLRRFEIVLTNPLLPEQSPQTGPSAWSKQSCSAEEPDLYLTAKIVPDQYGNDANWQA